MNRLTEHIPQGEHASKPFVRLIGGGIRWRYVETDNLQKAIDRLAAYEDTGLEPAECLANRERIGELEAENDALKISEGRWTVKATLFEARAQRREKAALAMQSVAKMAGDALEGEQAENKALKADNAALRACKLEAQEVARFILSNYLIKGLDPTMEALRDRLHRLAERQE